MTVLPYDPGAKRPSLSNVKLLELGEPENLNENVEARRSGKPTNCPYDEKANLTSYGISNDSVISDPEESSAMSLISIPVILATGVLVWVSFKFLKCKLTFFCSSLADRHLKG